MKIEERLRAGSFAGARTYLLKDAELMSAIEIEPDSARKIYFQALG